MKLYIDIGRTDHHFISDLIIEGIHIIERNGDTWIRMDNNDIAIKAALYSRFNGNRDLTIRDKSGKKIERLTLSELYGN